MSRITLVASTNMETVSNVPLKISVSSQKDKLNRTLSHWSLNYKFLLKENNVIFAGIKDENITSIEILPIMKKLISLNLINHLISFIPLTNKAFTLLEFTAPEHAERFKIQTVKLADTETFFVSKEPPSKFVAMYIDKLPAATLEEYLPNILQAWGQIISITPMKMYLTNGATCNSGTNKIIFKLNMEVTPTDMPYFIKIQNLRIYLHIPTRPKICFRCQSKTHLVSDCIFKYCSSCHTYKEPEHTCNKTYASRVIHRQDQWSALLQQAQTECETESLSIQFDSFNSTVLNQHVSADTSTPASEEAHGPLSLEHFPICKGDSSPLDSTHSCEHPSAENTSASVNVDMSGFPTKGANTQISTNDLTNISTPDITKSTVMSKFKRSALDQLSIPNSKKKINNDPVKTYSLRGKLLANATKSAQVQQNPQLEVEGLDTLAKENNTQMDFDHYDMETEHPT